MNEQYAEMITAFPLFRGFTLDGAHMLLDCGEVKELSPEAMLIEEGGAPTFVLLVLTGKLEIFVERHGRDLVLTEAGPGTILGELAVLCGIPAIRLSADDRELSRLAMECGGFSEPPSPQCFLVGADIPRIASHPHRERALANRVTRRLTRP